MDEARVVVGYCGTCGLATDKLPCPHCELTRRFNEAESLAKERTDG